MKKSLITDINTSCTLNDIKNIYIYDSEKNATVNSN